MALQDLEDVQNMASRQQAGVYGRAGKPGKGSSDGVTNRNNGTPQAAQRGKDMDTRTKKERICEGALTAFAHQEFSETTMDSIAELAGVSKGTLYYYFPTKEELFLYVVERGIDRLLGQIQPVIRSGISREEMLVKLLKVHLKFFDREQSLCQLLMSKSWGTKSLHQDIQKRICGYFRTMEQFFDQLQREGWIDPAISIPTLTSALFGMVGFTALRRIEMGLDVYTQETKLSLIALCRGALRAEGISPRTNHITMGDLR